MDRALFASSARSLGKGLAKDALGTSSEHVKAMLDDLVTTDLWCNTAAHFARGEVPEPIAQGIPIGRVTALDKGEGKVRGIVTGSCFRRLVAKTLAKQLSACNELLDDVVPLGNGSAAGWLGNLMMTSLV